MRDDKIFRSTRYLSAAIFPFLLAAFYILTLRTSETKQLFAWEIQAPMSAMMLGAAYIGGVYFFGRVTFGSHWHRVGLGLLPITAFASFMLIATVLHWDRFSHDQIAFYTWVVIYAITPFLVFAAWLNNRRTDPGHLEVNDIGWPRAARFILAGVGTANLVICLALFIQPALMVSVWPWNLTPLTARVVGSMFALQGVFGVAMARDPRWSAARIILETQFISMVFILIAVVRTWSTFDQTRAFTWVFVGSIVTILAGLPVLYLSLEARRRKPS